MSVLAELPKLYLHPTRRLTETKLPLGNTPVVTSDLKLKETESQGSLGPEISKNLSGASMEEDFERDLELNRLLIDSRLGLLQYRHFAVRVYDFVAS